MPKHESDYLQKTYGGLGVAELLAPKMKALQTFRQSLMNTALLEYIERQNATSRAREQIEQLGMEYDPHAVAPVISQPMALRTVRQATQQDDAIRAAMMAMENRTAEGVSFLDLNRVDWNNLDSQGSVANPTGYEEQYLHTPHPVRFERVRQNELHPTSPQWRKLWINVIDDWRIKPGQPFMEVGVNGNAHDRYLNRIWRNPHLTLSIHENWLVKCHALNMYRFSRWRRKSVGDLPMTITEAVIDWRYVGMLRRTSIEDPVPVLRVCVTNTDPRSTTAENVTEDFVYYVGSPGLGYMVYTTDEFTCMERAQVQSIDAAIAADMMEEKGETEMAAALQLEPSEIKGTKRTF